LLFRVQEYSGAMDECMPPNDENYELKRQLDELQFQSVGASCLTADADCCC